MEVDAQGASGDNGVVPRSAGNMERGNDNQSGTETTTADGDRIRAGGGGQSGRADRSADSLANRHDNDAQCKADYTGRMLVENARRSCFPDSQNGAATDLCRNRDGAESRWPAQCVWPTLYESARRIYLPEGRFRGPETPLAARNSRISGPIES